MSTDPFEPFAIIVSALLSELDDEARQRALERAGRELDRYRSRLSEYESAMMRRDAELVADEGRPSDAITDPGIIAFLWSLEE